MIVAVESPEGKPHPDAACVDLKERFGRHYRIEWEPGSRSRDPWYMQIPCRHNRGHICPWGPDVLAACTNSRRLTERLARLPYTTVHQDCDDGGNVLFPVDHLPEVAEIMEARKRRRLSEERKAALVEAGRRFRIFPGAGGFSATHSRVSERWLV